MARPRSNPEDLRVSPLVRQFFHLCEQTGENWEQLANRSGISRETYIRWQYNSIPKLDTFEAALNTLGYELTIKKRLSR